MMFDDRTEEGRIVLALIDERDRLRSRVAKLETALREILDDGCSHAQYDPGGCDGKCVRIAEDALARLDERGDPDA